MRKTVKIHGVLHRSGTSAKTGKAYDFTEVHFAYPDEYITGEKCANSVVDQTLLPYPLAVGDNVDMVFHFANGRCFIDAVL